MDFILIIILVVKLQIHVQIIQFGGLFDIPHFMEKFEKFQMEI